MPWRRLGSPQAGIEMEFDVSNATGEVSSVRAVNPTQQAWRLRIYDQNTNTDTFVADFPPGATRQNSVQAIPAGTLVVKQVINEDTGQPTPGAYYWDAGVQFVAL